jgi:hypothetical protein
MLAKLWLLCLSGQGKIHYYGASLPTATLLLFVLWANSTKLLHFTSIKFFEKVCGAETGVPNPEHKL